jgi:Helicase associated domain
MALEQYKRINGNCNVPHRSSEDTSLGTWVSHQKRDRDSLTSKQKSKLEALGFHFCTRQERLEDQWRTKYNKLIIFKSKFGHTNVPYYNQAHGAELSKWSKELGRWVKTQRHLRNTNTLASWKESLLNKLHFEWRPEKKRQAQRDKIWFNNYSILVKFHKEEGHASPKIGVVGGEAFYIWMKTQRRALKENRMRDDRKQLLDKIGFVWDMRAEKNPSMRVGMGEEIENRLDNHRLELRRNAYSNLQGKERTNCTLENDNGDDDNHMTCWEMGFRELVAYKESHGCFPPSAGAQSVLKSWITTQRRSERESRMPPSRRELLDSIGFWDEKNHKPVADCDIIENSNKSDNCVFGGCGSRDANASHPGNSRKTTTARNYKASENQMLELSFPVGTRFLKVSPKK